MKYNLSKLMHKAWSLYRKASKKAASSFSEALRAAWAWLKVQAANAEKVEAAAEAAGYADEVVHTWAGWQALGRMVMHTSEAVFKLSRRQRQMCIRDSLRTDPTDPGTVRPRTLQHSAGADSPQGTAIHKRGCTQYSAAPQKKQERGNTMQVIDLQAARQRREDDKIMRDAAQVCAKRARQMYPDVITATLQLDDAAEALAILRQLADIASTLHMLARNCKRREGGQA